MRRFRQYFLANMLLTLMWAAWAWAALFLLTYPIPPVIPYWIIFVCSAAIVWSYDAIMGPIFWRLDRKAREAEVTAQTAIIDARLAKIERKHSASGRKRAQRKAA